MKRKHDGRIGLPSTPSELGSKASFADQRDFAGREKGELRRFLGSHEWLLGVVLVFATLMAYKPAWHGEQVWDDNAHVMWPEVRSLTGLARIWTQPGTTQQYYPVVYTAF